MKTMENRTRSKRKMATPSQILRTLYISADFSQSDTAGQQIKQTKDLLTSAKITIIIVYIKLNYIGTDCGVLGHIHYIIPVVLSYFLSRVVLFMCHL